MCVELVFLVPRCVSIASIRLVAEAWIPGTRLLDRSLSRLKLDELDLSLFSSDFARRLL